MSPQVTDSTHCGGQYQWTDPRTTPVITHFCTQLSFVLTQTWGSWYNPPRFDMTWCPCQFSPEQNRMPVPFSLCTMSKFPWFLWCSSGTASRGQCSELWSSNAEKAVPNKFDRQVKDGRFAGRYGVQTKKKSQRDRYSTKFYCLQSFLSKMAIVHNTWLQWSTCYCTQLINPTSICFKTIFPPKPNYINNRFFGIQLSFICLFAT